MGYTTIMVAIFALVFVIGESQAGGTGGCPLPSKIYSCSPKCVQSYECTHGKVCCPNACNAKSCVEASPNGAGGGDKYSQSGGAGTYCNNVKCNSFEVCKMDPSTKRMKCQRP